MLVVICRPEFKWMLHNEQIQLYDVRHFKHCTVHTYICNIQYQKVKAKYKFCFSLSLHLDLLVLQPCSYCCLLETNNYIVIPTFKFLPLNSQPQPLSLNYLPTINDISLFCSVHPCVTSTASTPLSYAVPSLFYCLSLILICPACLTFRNPASYI
jgi:hypothetical protein